ncbi:MAG: Rpn family recombination-promoting nuclease/putative transposase [Candidatus Riflebacteria bacterium]|nr:Rpn family recombination-promoting nuclease/putative transposase [Candidatus Riflebacteria bacterium]
MRRFDLSGRTNEQNSLKIYSFLNDFVFKCVFGQEKNSKLLVCLLNAFLSLKGNDKIVEVQIVNPFNEKDFQSEKLCILDIKAVDLTKRRFNIEVQVREFDAYIDRATYYLAKLYSSQLQAGEDYTALCKATGISILDFEVFPEFKTARSVYRLMDSENSHVLEDTIELHFIELPKLAEKLKNKPQTPFEKWLHLLKFGENYFNNEENIPIDLAEEEGIKLTINQFCLVNSNEHFRAAIEAREKAIRDEATRLKTAVENAFKNGEEKGFKNGEEKTKIETAKNLLSMGVSIEIASEATGLSIEEIRNFSIK